MSALRFFAPGRPVGQGSKTSGKTRDGRVYFRESSSNALKPWRASIGQSALAARAAERWPIRHGPIRLSVVFVIPRPKRLGSRPSTPSDAMGFPDRDKLLRAVQDALSGVIYLDDRQVIAGPADKRMAEPGEEPGAWIEVEVIEASHCKEESAAS